MELGGGTKEPEGCSRDAGGHTENGSAVVQARVAKLQTQPRGRPDRPERVKVVAVEPQQ